MTEDTSNSATKFGENCVTQHIEGCHSQNHNQLSELLSCKLPSCQLQVAQLSGHQYVYEYRFYSTSGTKSPKDYIKSGVATNYALQYMVCQMRISKEYHSYHVRESKFSSVATST